jgi:hypothetical protein
MREYQTSLPKLLLGGVFAALMLAPSLAYAKPPCYPPRHWIQVSHDHWVCALNNYWQIGRQRGHRNKAGVKAPVDKSMVLDR